MEFDDIFDDEKEYNADFREYSPLENPTDIGVWQSYAPYHDSEQLQLQLDNLLSLPLANSYGKICFVLSKNIAKTEEYLENISKKISIENTETVLDTEVYYTSKIEGARTTKKRTFEIHNGWQIDSSDFSECMIKGNFEAVKLLNLYGNAVNKSNIKKIWDALTNGCRDNEDIQGDLYRIGEVFITDSSFVSVSPDSLDQAMDDFFEFYNGSILNDKPFIKASIIHFVFETIHPFCDGNGRLGRLLMNNYLIGQGIESCRAVSFSEQIDKKRGLYDNAFEASENQFSDCTPFVEYMLQAMCDGYLTAWEIQKK